MDQSCDSTLGSAPPRRLAFGVDPQRAERYSLRQARYNAAARDINAWAAAAGRTLALLDVGCGSGSLLRHLEAEPHFRAVALSATNFYERSTYKQHAYQDYVICDLTKPCPQLPSEAYDVVVCEQVLEHLSDLDVAFGTLCRVTRPGGMLILGVPIFVPPLHLVRRHVVPRIDRLLGGRRSRGHVQAFSMWSLLRRIAAAPGLRVLEVRGFRIVSGGVLRPLENHRWYWRLNRQLGRWLPWACIEVQVVLRKEDRASERDGVPSS